MTKLVRTVLCVILLAGLAFGCGGDDGGGGGIDAAGGGGGDPVASFTATPDCTSSSSTEITFTSTSTDPENQTLSCSWTFSSCTNGQCSSTQCTQGGITFPHAAPYPVTLTVTDTDGNSDSVTINVDRC